MAQTTMQKALAAQRTNFKLAVTEFCEMLLQDFPDCAKLRSAFDKWDCSILQCSTPSLQESLLNKAMSLFNTNLERYYVRITKHDASVVDDIDHPLFADLDLRGKFDMYATDERECVFAHLDNMCAIVASYVRNVAAMEAKAAAE